MTASMIDTLRGCNIAGPQRSLPRGRGYPLRVRNSGGTTSWSSYAKQARLQAGLSMAGLARDLGVDRTTIYRWETEGQAPTDSKVVYRFAELVKVDPQEALRACGILADGANPPRRPAHIEQDPEIALILEADVSDDLKEDLIKHVRRRRAEDQRRRMEDVRLLLRRSDNHASGVT